MRTRVGSILAIAALAFGGACASSSSHGASGGHDGGDARGGGGAATGSGGQPGGGGREVGLGSGGSESSGSSGGQVSGGGYAGGVSGGGGQMAGAGQAGQAGTGGGSGQGGRAGVSGGGGSVAVPGLGACQIPSVSKFSDAESAYAKFKTDLVTSDGAGGFLRVRRPNSSGAIDTTASEGIGYGMLIAVYMNDQTTFDQFWKYEQLHLDARGLMNWEINPTGTAPTAQGAGAATDGDEDMAFALVMADKKWGGSGTLSDTYLNTAKKLIDLIWQYEVDHNSSLLLPGDQFGGAQVINISYFAPAYYRVFGRVTGKTAEWTGVVDSSYQALSAALNPTNGNADNGLVPAWSTPTGVPMAPSGTSHPTYYQLDSCRTPFRIGQDYCWFNEARALTYLQKISKFYAGVGAANILDAYNLNGTPYSGASLHLAAFVGPAGVGAMGIPAYGTLVSQSYTALVTAPGLLGGSLYYNESWTVLSLLMLNGRLLNLAN